MTRVDPELGPEKLCAVCGEWWPLDDEFWYFRVIPAGESYVSRGRMYVRTVAARHVYARCRACWAVRNREQHAARKAVA